MGGKDLDQKKMRKIAAAVGTPDPQSTQEQTATESRGDESRSALSPGSGSNEEGRQEEQEGDEVSLMLCNIPCRLSHDDLVEAINSVGFAGLFDFVHLPPSRYWPRECARSTARSAGYAFVHFNSAEHASAFAKRFQNYQFQSSSSDKRCEVKPAHMNLRQKEAHRAKAAQDLKNAGNARQPKQPKAKATTGNSSMGTTTAAETPGTYSSELQTATATPSDGEGDFLNSESSNSLGEETLSAVRPTPPSKEEDEEEIGNSVMLGNIYLQEQHEFSFPEA